MEVAIRTDRVFVVFTTIDATLAALRVASKFGRAMSAPVTLLHFRAVPFRHSVNAPAGVSPVETESFAERLRLEGLDARVRVCLCRNEGDAIPLTIPRRSLVVVGGQRGWWPTAATRLRRLLEAAGHYVVFVEQPSQREVLSA